MRCNGTFAAAAAARSGNACCQACTPSVAANGHTTLTRMPSAAHSFAATRLTARIASFAAAYDVCVGMPSRADPEPKLTTEPRACLSCG